MKILTSRQTKALIKKRNDTFRKLSLDDKRVAIAKDVLENIKTKKFEPQTGAWLGYRTHMGVAEDDDRGIRESVLSGQVFCTGCALGGLMLSCTLYNNKYKLHDIYNSTDFTLGNVIIDEKPLKNNFNKIFLKEQLILIEMAFERGLGSFRSMTESREKAKLFGQKFENSKDRLRNIMLNIIKNKGTFVP
jgi:hypothetical protein